VEKRARRLPTVAALAAAIIPAVIVSDAASYLIATVAHAAGVSHSFGPLQFATYTFLIVDGVVAGAIGWQVLRNRVSNPSRLLSRLVPAVLALSFVPDVLIGITHSEKATTWGGVIALMCMHVVVAAAAVAGYTRFLPVPKPSEAV
jgi:hypothetical protein